MKVATIATVRVQDGKGPELEATFAKVKALIAAKEPGTLLYELTHSQEDANLYKVLEIYRDAAAREAHGKYPEFAEAFAGMPGIAAGPPGLEFLDLIE